MLISILYYYFCTSARSAIPILSSKLLMIVRFHRLRFPIRLLASLVRSGRRLAVVSSALPRRRLTTASSPCRPRRTNLSSIAPLSLLLSKFAFVYIYILINYSRLSWSTEGIVHCTGITRVCRCQFHVGTVKIIHFGWYGSVFKTLISIYSTLFMWILFYLN